MARPTVASRMQTYGRAVGYMKYAPAMFKAGRKIWQKFSQAQRQAPSNSRTKAQKKARNRVVKKFRTRSHMGRNRGGNYAGRFKKPRGKSYRKGMKLARNGVTFKLERGSVEEALINHTVYVGHGVAVRQLWQNVLRALVKALFAKAGIDISNFNDPVQAVLDRTILTDVIACNIGFNYKNDPAAVDWTSVTFDFVFGVSDTFEGLVELIRSRIATNVTTTVANYGQLMFGTFAMGFQLSQTAIVQDTIEASIDMEGFYLDMKVMSNLTMQNRTNDAGGTSNILSTSNNPIHGKHYVSNKKWLNGFDLNRTQLNTIDAANVPLYASASDGIIATSSDVTQPQILQKPPAAYHLQVNKCNNISMQPGNVKKSYINWSTSMKWNTFVAKINKYVDQTASGRCEIGFAELFGFECMLYDRTETTPIQIAWELNQTYTVATRYKRPMTVPTISVI